MHYEYLYCEIQEIALNLNKLSGKIVTPETATHQTNFITGVKSFQLRQAAVLIDGTVYYDVIAECELMYPRQVTLWKEKQP